MNHNSNGTPPFPALTPGQRLFFEVNGYVVVENTLTTQEVDRLRDTLYRLREKFLAADDPNTFSINGCHTFQIGPHYANLVHLLEADPAFFDYLTHPRIVGLAEEAAGGKVRIDESGAIINSRMDDDDPHKHHELQFHRGGQPGFDSYYHGDLYHCTFMKTLTNLTDLGPDDGGTTVIAGSHKLNCSENEMVAAAYEKPELIHQVQGPAGSTMLMCETLIHATGHKRSDGDRVVIIGGYSHPKYQAQGGQAPSAQFVEKTPEHLRELLTGRPYWTWPERHRPLGMPAEQAGVQYKARMWSIEHRQ